MLEQNRYCPHLIRCRSISGMPVEVETNCRCLQAVFAGYLDVLCGVLAVMSKTLFAESHYLQLISRYRVH
jgi:hypothetical protein